VQTRFEYYFGTSEGDPRAEVTLAPKVMLYGTTYSKATNGYGTVFAFNRSTGLETTLHAFNGTDGAYPMAGVTRGADGMLYGATANGGPDGPGGYGTLFKINPANGKFTQIYAFTGDRDGGDPMATLVFDASGTYLYGSTSTLSGPGTIFKFNIKTKELTTLYHFTGTWTAPRCIIARSPGMPRAPSSTVPAIRPGNTSRACCSHSIPPQRPWCHCTSSPEKRTGLALPMV
jgi:uncharacterized repeat protein (TIGR03803 family)